MQAMEQCRVQPGRGASSRCTPRLCPGLTPGDVHAGVTVTCPESGLVLLCASTILPGVGLNMAPCAGGGREETPHGPTAALPVKLNKSC